MQAEQQSDLLPCPFCGGEATGNQAGRFGGANPLDAVAASHPSPQGSQP